MILSAISKLFRTIADKIDQPTENVYLKSLLDAHYEGLHIYWVSTHHEILLSNITQALILNQTQDTLAGKTIEEIGAQFAEESASQQLCQNNEKVMASQKSLTFEEIFDNKTYLSYKAPFYDKKGKMQGIIGISNDITTQKQFEEFLHTSKKSADIYLESILMSSQNNIFWVDTQSRIIGCNDQQAKLMGLNSRLDLIGKTIFDVGKMLSWDDSIPQKIRDNDLDVIQNKKTIITEEYGTFDGEIKYFLSSKSPMLNDQGQAIGVLGISTDITKQKNTEKALKEAKKAAEAASQAKSRFLANISHDIRTPLAGIHGIISDLLDRTPPEFHDELTAVINASNELMGLLNNVIHLTKYEYEDQDTYPLESIDLQNLLHNLRNLFLPTAQQKKLTLEVIYPKYLPRQFIGASFLLQHVLLNLISNALKFTEQGGVTIHVNRNNTAALTDTDMITLTITVEDTGIGIPEADLNQIFEPFYRLQPSYQDKNKGNGLGLAIVKRFVEKFQGKIKVHSQINKGSQFILNLPLKIDIKAPASANDPVKKNVQDLSPPSPMQILFIEDNPLIQKTVAALLTKMNNRVDVGGTGIKGVQMAREMQYDLIFLDIGLPDSDGFDVARQIRAIPEYAQTPIIALTAHLDEDQRETCLQAGINEITIKPLTSETANFFLTKYKNQPLL